MHTFVRVYIHLFTVWYFSPQPRHFHPPPWVTRVCSRMSRRTVRRLKPESIIAVLGRFRVSFRLMYLAAEFNRVLEPLANSSASDKFRRLGDTGAALIGRFDDEDGVAVPPNAAVSASVGAVARVPTADWARCRAGDDRAFSNNGVLCTGDVCVMSKPT